MFSSCHQARLVPFSLQPHTCWQPPTCPQCGKQLCCKAVHTDPQPQQGRGQGHPTVHPANAPPAPAARLQEPGCSFSEKPPH